MHKHIIGGTRYGKSKYLEFLIRRMVRHGEGFMLIDPHGYLSDDLFRYLSVSPLKRKVVVLDPANPSYTFAFNPLAYGGDLYYGVDAMAEALRQAWGDENSDKTPLLERMMRAVLYALAERGMTLVEGVKLLNAEKSMRKRVTSLVKDSIFADRWKSINDYTQKQFLEAFASTENRLAKLVDPPIMRLILGQTKNLIDVRALMEEGAAVIVNLRAKDPMPSDAAKTLGRLLVSTIFLHAKNRDDGARPFHLIIDECHEFATPELGRILTGGLKFGLHVTFAHQDLKQLETVGLLESALSTAHEHVVFGGLSPDDAETMARLFFLPQIAQDKINHDFDRPTVVDHEIITLKAQSESESEASATGMASGSTNSFTHSMGSGMSEHPDALYAYETMNHGSSGGRSNSSSRSDVKAYGRAYGKHEGLKPVMQVLPTKLYTPEEKTLHYMAELLNLAKRHCYVKPPGEDPALYVVPEVKKGEARDPFKNRYVREQMERYGIRRNVAENILHARNLLFGVPQEERELDLDDYFE